MNLNEALNILESNNYIYEFLEHSVSKEQLQKLIEKRFRLFLKDCSIKDYDLYANSIIDSNKACSFKALNRSTLKPIEEKLAKFVEKYGWYLRDVRDDIIYLEDVKGLRKDSRNEYCFIHMSYTSPEIILKTGLRPKTYNRIYLCQIKNKDELDDSNIIHEIPPKSSNNDEEIYHYMYLIELPKNIPIYTDPEYGEEDSACFIDVPIPPKYITYIGYVNY